MKPWTAISIHELVRDIYRKPGSDKPTWGFSEEAMAEFPKRGPFWEDWEANKNTTMRRGFTLWLYQNSYWKLPFIVDLPMKNMVIFP
jgi:hypothetical protein